MQHLILRLAHRLAHCWLRLHLLSTYYVSGTALISSHVLTLSLLKQFSGSCHYSYLKIWSLKKGEVNNLSKVTYLEGGSAVIWTEASFNHYKWLSSYGKERKSVSGWFYVYIVIAKSISFVQLFCRLLNADTAGSWRQCGPWSLLPEHKRPSLITLMQYTCTELSRDLHDRVHLFFVYLTRICLWQCWRCWHWVASVGNVGLHWNLNYFSF